MPVLKGLLLLSALGLFLSLDSFQGQDRKVVFIAFVCTLAAGLCTSADSKPERHPPLGGD